jgi:hypothetical protein
VDGVTVNIQVIVHVCPSARAGIKNSTPVVVSAMAMSVEHAGAGEHAAVAPLELSVDGSRAQVLKD